MAVPNVIYNINVKSKFELFLDDDLCEAEPEELVKKISEEKKRKDLALKEAKKQKHTEVKKVALKPTVAADIEPSQPKSEEKINNNEKAPRFQKIDSNRGQMKPKMAAQKTAATKGEVVVEEESGEDKSRPNRGKKAYVAGGGAQAGQQAQAQRRGRGREFDRHSGSDKTGVKSVERRDGSGSYNWGTVKDIVDLTQEPTVPEPKEDAEESGQNSDTAAAAAVDKKEVEKPAMTISEWKALHSSSSNVISSHVPTRPANNGENVFTGMNLYQKRNGPTNESDNEVVVPEDETDSKGRRQIKVNIEFSGRGRRGRTGGFSNSRFNRRDDDGNKESTFAKDGAVVINMDEEEFPTLS